MSGAYEITLVIERVKDEHVAYFARMAMAVGALFKLEGTDVETRVSVERNHDGVERVYEYLPEEVD